MFHICFFQTNFVRQKTPHPKELKAKAHKLFGNKKPIEETKQENEQNGGDGDKIPVTNINNLQSEPVSQTRAFFSENDPVVHEAVNNFAGEEIEDDEEEVSQIYSGKSFSLKMLLLYTYVFDQTRDFLLFQCLPESYYV